MWAGRVQDLVQDVGRLPLGIELGEVRAERVPRPLQAMAGDAVGDGENLLAVAEVAAPRSATSSPTGSGQVGQRPFGSRPAILKQCILVASILDARHVLFGIGQIGVEIVDHVQAPRTSAANGRDTCRR